MRDRGSERPAGGPLGVDVDPLVIAGGVGEPVDALLRDLQPGARPEDFADGGTQFVDRRELGIFGGPGYETLTCTWSKWFAVRLPRSSMAFHWLVGWPASQMCCW